jgi:SAM-dependent methyltransferase
MSELEITNNKVFVGIPRERFGMHEFTDSRDKVLSTLNDAGALAEGNIYQITSHRVDLNRGRITDNFLGQPDKPDWLLMLDSDMDHHPECGLKLRDRQVPIVGGLYFHRSPHRYHDPLAFMLHEEVEDEDGYLVPFWTPIRDYVQAFMERTGVPIRAGGYIISSPPEDSLVPVDSVATGCMMIHRSVFEAMDPPIWDYRTRRGSEDLDFCFRAKEKGFQTYVDLAVVGGHYKMKPVGHNEFMKFFRVRGLWQTEYDESEAMGWLERYAGVENPGELMREYTPEILSDIWDDHVHEYMGDAPSFYERDDTGETYLRDLLWWNASDVFRSIRSKLIGLEGIDVLEFGSGIGTVSAQMGLQNNRVVSVEVNDVLRSFAKKRWEDHRENPYSESKLGTVLFVKEIDEMPDRMFDLIIAIDVLEHLGTDDLIEYVHELVSMLKIGGRFFAHNNWGQQDIYPMHYDHSELWAQLVKDNGLFQLEDMWWVKIK